MPVGRLAVLVVVAAATACGGGTVVNERRPAGPSLEVRFSPDPLRAGKPVVFSLKVTNATDEAVTLTFSSGQSGDVVLLRDGDEAYRWSAERLFTEAIRKEPLGPGERRVYRLEEPALAVEPGDYELVASLAAEPAPKPVRRAVTVVG